MSRAIPEFINSSNNVFTDISSEMFRVYEFPNNSSTRIDSPYQLSVSESGGHRILDYEGVSHYIPTGWIHLYWKSFDGKPKFVK